MAEIKCPNCGEKFTVDEAGYAAIVAQVRGYELEQEAQEKAELLAASKDAELAKLRAELEAAESAAQKELELAVAKARESAAASDASKEKDIARLQTQLDAAKSAAAKDIKLAVSEAVAEKEKELNELRLKEQSAKLGYESMISAKDEEIAFYKDFKARESTKMIGEDLEQHCLTEFEKLRSAAFRNASFEKDNTVSASGSKGDFIFRDYDEEGKEFISIMFEMKNEVDTTATKRTNKNFLKELDKDRNEKSCEYAVLVSMLEADSELYNQGIVDMSHEYKKMYVVRPQFFIPIISVLRNAALNSLEWQHALIKAQSERADIDELESEIEEFKEKFGNNFRLAAEHYEKAVDNIDKTIRSLEKTRDELIKSMKNLKWANDKAEDISLYISSKNDKSSADM